MRYMGVMRGRTREKRRRWVQMELRSRRGGRRRGAGRKRRGRKMVAHRRRRVIRRRTVVHVTVRVVKAAGRLRRRRLVPVLRAALVAGAVKDGFRICHFSIQGNHIHLVTEARSNAALARGMQGFQVSAARRLNRLLGRSGKVFEDRYHDVHLTSPRQVRAALCYVLNNARRHGERLDARFGGVDPFSSAWYFDGWAGDGWRRGLAPPPAPPPVAPAESWLLTTGWRRCGPIELEETPGPRS
jgi:REP element-mobilizing transposase RayT